MSEVGIQGLRAVMAMPRSALVAVDFDGTLAPIVDNPETAMADPEAVRALGRIARHVGTVAVITGRPARTAVRLGEFEQTPGLESLVVLGQYGAERWEAATGRFDAAPEPEAIAAVEAELPALFAEAGVPDARVEHKGRAIGIHTRELADSLGAFNVLLEPLQDLAARHGLQVEPGRNVLEIRAHGTDKGETLRSLVTETGTESVVFAGDDLGDLPAFRMVQQLRTEGIPGFLVCSASHEQDALAELADLVVAGPPGVGGWLSTLADNLDQAASNA